MNLNSDHSPLVLTLSENIIKKELKPILINKTTNWKYFQVDLSNKIQLKIRCKTRNS